MNNTKIILKSKINNISLARNFIQIIAMDYNPTISFINEIKTAISEAVTNSIIHGYEGNEEKDIVLDVTTSDEFIKIVIIDEGVGINNVDEAREPMFSTKKETDRSGLGFTIMEIFCDEFDVVSEEGKGTKITLVKKWQKNE